MCGKTAECGVTAVNNLCSDPPNWNTPYLAGRMHKLIRIIKNDPRVRHAQQVNITLAIRAAILTLPEKFAESDLSKDSRPEFRWRYSNDLTPENRNGVESVVQEQDPQLYYRPATGLPGVYQRNHCTSVVQDRFAGRKADPFTQTPAGVTEGCHFITTPRTSPSTGRKFLPDLTSTV